MIKFRWYVDSQKEQDWLNKMSKKGWALKSFLLGFYKFEKCEPGEYIYQIDLLPEGKSKKEIREFYKKQAISIVDEMKTNNRQKALETKSNFKNTKQNIKGWAF